MPKGVKSFRKTFDRRHALTLGMLRPGLSASAELREIWSAMLEAAPCPSDASSQPVSPVDAD